MLVERFVSWSRTAPVEDRVRTVRKLCEAWRYAALPDDERRTTAAVLTVALDDSSTKVRVALAEGLGHCDDAPRHILLSLAADVPDVARVAIGSPVLAEEDVVALVETSEAVALAVAGHARLTPGLARAIVLHGDAKAARCLLANRQLILSDSVLTHIAERHGDDPIVRRSLLKQDLPTELRLVLRRGLARDLTQHALAKGWLSRARTERLVSQDADDAALKASCSLDMDASLELAIDMAEEGRLTFALLLRAAVNGHLTFLEAACAALAEAPVARIVSAFRSRRPAPLRAFLLKAGIGANEGAMLAQAHRRWLSEQRHSHADAATENLRVRRLVLREVAALAGSRASPVVAGFLAEIEVGLEREASRAHSQQVLLAA